MKGADLASFSDMPCLQRILEHETNGLEKSIESEAALGEANSGRLSLD